ncbi:uncharacterized protein BCR38DRAFT_345505 [Pseudomassariella vexata]|uniref:Rhodopsin domain-containing protein n=1 Tax=Pseudomassariella vexata TaxID=1141098 RepID=A0A1Y2DV09_9PEZI|nr:uncharacterized protein BCR38DRAFT_345505 [Pseudomassariella vexata]ORY62964.1 hypothetical protein BCR38DRAFT_345505 [Pseudomassariella vexata]
MALYSPPPPLHAFERDKPTLLVCWWITLFCTTIILLRVAGRFVRSEKLFAEDRTAALAIIPLYLRMGCVHVILVYGTNNAQIPNDLTEEELRMKSIASGLVLASRIFYATTLWILKSAILEFFKRLTKTTWKRSHEITLLWIRCTLIATFIAVLISDLTECRPFQHYYQVLPDPGGQCRQGYAQLLTMATCNVITDLLLVFFPVSIIWRSHMTVKRKVQLVLLFSLSLAVVGTTLYRVPHTIWQNGSQQIRSLLASIELLFATAAANALVLGSFVRDRGVKKARYRHGSIAADSVNGFSRSRRPTLQRHWGSDEELVRGLGLGVDRELRDSPELGGPIPQRQYTPAGPIGKFPEDMSSWQFPTRKGSNAERSDDSLLPHNLTSSSRSNSGTTPRKVSFFDVGGLLPDEQNQSLRDSYNSSLDPLSPTTLHGVPSPSFPAGTTGFRRGSQALLQDLGGFLSPFGAKSRSNSKTSATGTELQMMQQHPEESPKRQDNYRNAPMPMDAGGLLAPLTA